MRDDGKAWDVINGRLAHGGWGIGISRAETVTHVLQGLIDANLLKTEAEARLLNALFSTNYNDPEYVAAYDGVRAERAAAVPQPRWEVRPKTTTYDEDEWIVMVPGTTKRNGYWTRAEAEAVAAALNAIDPATVEAPK